MATPINYRTLTGLLKATERMLSDDHHGTRTRFDGMSRGMWLHNAAHAALTNFNDESSVQALQMKWSASRPQDLKGGHSLFGIPLPVHERSAGDNIPGIGLIQEVYGEQYRVNGNWYHKRCFENAAHS